jgi:uncharacterized protein YbjT (DUF2867 family)
MTTLITGGSGVIGGAVARALAGRVPMALASRRRRPDARHLDYDDPATHTTALRGIRTVFLVAPPADPRSAERLAPFLDTAVRGGVEHVVVCSAPMARLDPDFSLARLERAVEASSCAWTHVRTQWHMAAFTVGLFANQVAAGELALPTGAGGIAYVDPLDLAEVIAAVLTDPPAHAGGTHEVTGPDILDGWTAARQCGIDFHPVDDATYLHRCAATGMPDDVAHFLLALFTAARYGHCEYTTDTVAQLTGHRPGRFETFLRRARRHLPASRTPAGR